VVGGALRGTRNCFQHRGEASEAASDNDQGSHSIRNPIEDKHSQNLCKNGMCLRRLPGDR
jgi:hypothetical protein